MRAGVFGRVARRPSSKQSNNNNNKYISLRKT